MASHSERRSELKSAPLNRGGRGAGAPSLDLDGQVRDTKQHLLGELQARQEELEQQNEKLRRALADLKNSQERFANPYDDAPVACLALDIDATISEANPTAAELLGVDRRQLLGAKFTNYVAPESLEVLGQHQHAVLNSGEKRACELWLRRSDGSTFPAQLDTIHIASTGSGTPRCRCVITDLTERKRTETQLRLSEQQYRSLYDRNLDAVYMVDAQGRFMDANPAGTKLCGYSVEELRERTFMDLCAPDCLEITVAAFRDGMAGRPRDIESALIRKDGRRVDIWIAGMPVVVDGETIGAFGIVRDITDRKAAESRLRHSEERLRRSQSIANVGSWELDLARRQLTWSDETYRIFGVAPEQFDGSYQSYLDCIHPEDRTTVDGAYTDSILEGRDTYELEHRVIRKDNKAVRIVHEKCEHLRDANGSVVRSIGMVQDITERKQAEQALEQERALLRTLIDHLPDWVYVKDTQHRFITANIVTAWGMGVHSPSDLVGFTDAEFYPQEQAAEYRADEAQILSTGEALIDKDEAHTDAAGNRLEILTTKLPLRGQDGTIVGLVGVGRDITEYRRAERSLIESEDRLRLAVQGANVGLWYWNFQTNKVDYSREWKRQLGYEDHEIGDGIGEWESRIHPEDLGPVLEQTRRCRASPRGVYDVEFRMLAKDGTWHWIYSRGEVLRDSNGQAIRMTGCHVDITDRKQAESELRRSEERLRQSIRVARLGHFEHDHLTDDIYYSRIMREIWGLTPDETVTLPKITAGVHHEDRAAFISAVKAAHDPLGDGSFFSEHRVVRAEGSVRWVSARSQTFFAGEGPERRPVRTIGALVDITSAKEAERRLRELNATLEQRVADRTRALTESEMRIRLFVQHTPAAVAMFDRHMNYLIVSRRWLEDYHLTEQEIVGRSHYDMFPDVQERWKPYHERCLAGEVIRCEEDTIRRADGQLEWVRWELRPWPTASGEIGGLIMFAEVITERKVAEQALVDSEQHLRAVVDSAADGIVTLDDRGVIESMNPAALKLFGYRLREIVGQPMNRLLQSSSQQPWEAFLSNYLQDASNPVLGHAHELAGRRKDGATISLELTLVNFAHSGKTGHVAILHNLTERKRLERELLEAGERERQQVGYELHDDLGQILHGIQFLATDLQSRLERQGVAEAAELRRVARHLDEALATTRSLARGLQPVPPVPEGLMNALREHASRVRKLYGVSCRFVCSKPVLVSDPKVATHLFRITQEAVTNAIKHARCRGIVIQLKTSQDRLLLGIKDDGHGRFPAPGRQRGMGLHVMQFRAAAINGSLAVRRKPGEGTEVVCSVEPVAVQNSNHGGHPMKPRKLK